MALRSRVNLRRRVLFRLATSAALERASGRVSAVQRGLYRPARRYVLASRDDALRVASELGRQGIEVSIDYFGEQETSEERSRRAVAEFGSLAGELISIPTAHLSVDLSHIGVDISPALALELLEEIARHLPSGRLIQVGAEDEARRASIKQVLLDGAERGLPLSATVQANLLSAEEDGLAYVRAGLPVRLVKGAYVERSDVSRPWGPETDTAYIELARRFRAAGGRVMLATHDPVVRVGAEDETRSDEVEMLLGVREGDARSLAASGRTVRVYVPYGERWFRYWMRRLAEAQGK